MIEIRPKIKNLQDCELVKYIRENREPRGVSEELRRFYTEYQIQEDREKYHPNN